VFNPLWCVPWKNESTIHFQEKKNKKETTRICLGRAVSRRMINSETIIVVRIFFFNFAELIGEMPPAKRTFSRRETRSPVQHGAFNIGHHYYHCRLHAWACIRPRASLAKSHSINYRETLSKKLNNFWLVRHLFFNTCLKWDRYNK